jgi:tetratricopeptide (TPR) repeat protein
MGDEIELPGEIYGFGNLLLWMVATRAPSLADRVFDATPARRKTAYGTVNGHHLPTQALIARLITAAEFGLPPERLTESGPAMKRQEALRSMVSRAMTEKPHLFKIEWLRALANMCGFSAADMQVLSDGRAEAGAQVDYAALRTAIANTQRNTQRSSHRPSPANGTRNSAPATVTRMLPRDARCFTGRASQLRELAALVRADAAGDEAQGAAPRVCAIDGMAGSGKSAFAVRVAREFAAGFPDGCFHVRLHGHSADQRQASPLDALAGLLRADGIPPQAIPGDLADCARLWRERMASRKAIVILDDATGPRQVLPLLPGAAQTLVLITSRRRLASLPGAHFVTISVLDPADAARMFTGLANRAEINIKDKSNPKIPNLKINDEEMNEAGIDLETAELMRLCGYLPQAIGLLAGHLARHRAGTVADLIAPMTRPGARLALLVGEHESIAAAFDLSYRSLPADLRQLFRRLGLHPGPEIDPWSAGALDDRAPDSARAQLKRLAGYNLIEHPAEDRFRFHDLIADHARILAAADPAADRAAAERRLLDYGLHMARSADRFLARRTATGVPATGVSATGMPAFGVLTTGVPATGVSATGVPATGVPVTGVPASGVSATGVPATGVPATGVPVTGVSAIASAGPARAPELPTRSSAIGWLDANYPQLLAIAGYAATHGHPDYAIAISAAMNGYLLGQGRWHQALELHSLALAVARASDDKPAVAGLLSDIAAVQYRIGDVKTATVNLGLALDLQRSLGDRLGEAHALRRRGTVCCATGDYPAAEADFTAALALYDGTDDRYCEAETRSNLGVVQYETGRLQAAAASQSAALDQYQAIGSTVGQGDALCYLAQIHADGGDYPEAIASYDRALALYRQGAEEPRTAGALFYLGAALRQAGDHDSAMANLTEALGIYRQFDDRFDEAGVLNQIGLIQTAQGAHAEAAATLEKSLALYRRYESKNGEVEVRNGMGELALATGADNEARDHFLLALTMAADNDIPREKARALAGIGRCLLKEPNQRDAAIMSLTQARDLYQQMNSPHATAIAQLLSTIAALVAGRLRRPTLLVRRPLVSRRDP